MIISDSETWRAYTGQALEELMKPDGWMEAVHPDDREYAGMYWHDAVENKKPFDAVFRLRRPDDTYRWTSVRATPLPNPDSSVKKWVGINVDIHERKTAEETLARERDLLQAVMNSAGKAHLVYLDRDFNFVRVNETYAATCGYRPEEMIGKNHFALYPGAEVEAIFRQVRDTGQAIEIHDRPFEFPEKPERGVTYWDWTLIPLKDDSGQVTGLTFSLFETTERKQAEKDLRESGERLRSLAENVPCVLMRFDRQLRIAYLNPQSERYNPIPVECLIGRTNREVGMQVELCELWDAAIERVFETGSQEEMEFDFDGVSGMRTFALKFAPEFGPDHEVRYVLGVSSDITERKRAEAELEKIRELLTEGQRIANLGIFEYIGGKLLRYVGATLDITDRRNTEEQLKRLNETLEQQVAERTKLSDARAKQLQKLTDRG